MPRLGHCGPENDSDSGIVSLTAHGAPVGARPHRGHGPCARPVRCSAACGVQPTAKRARAWARAAAARRGGPVGGVLEQRGSGSSCTARRCRSAFERPARSATGGASYRPGHPFAASTSRWARLASMRASSPGSGAAHRLRAWAVSNRCCASSIGSGVQPPRPTRPCAGHLLATTGAAHAVAPRPAPGCRASAVFAPPLAGQPQRERPFPPPIRAGPGWRSSGRSLRPATAWPARRQAVGGLMLAAGLRVACGGRLGLGCRDQACSSTCACLRCLQTGQAGAVTSMGASFNLVIRGARFMRRWGHGVHGAAPPPTGSFPEDYKSVISTIQAALGAGTIGAVPSAALPP